MKKCARKKSTRREKLVDKIVYVYHTIDDNIPYAELKTKLEDAYECALKHFEGNEFRPTHVLINDNDKISYEDLAMLYAVKVRVSECKANGIKESDMYFDDLDESDEGDECEDN